MYSTNPSGEFEPGALQVSWINPCRETRNALESSAVQSPQDRVADFVIWDVHAKMYLTVVEVKSASAGSTQQMIGLFRPNQR